MLTESELKKHLSGGHFKNIYLIFGEEKMLVKRSTELIEKKISGGTLSEFNYHVFDNNSEITDLSVSVDIVPFMSEWNIVKLVDVDFDKMKADDFKTMLQILEHVPATTVLIITMPTLEVTSKTAKSQMKKLIALADKSGVCMELGHRSGLALERDMCKWAKAGGCSMSELTAHTLIQYVGEDLNRLNAEMKKLTAYADGSEITPEMIELLVHKTTEASIYDLFGCIINGDSDRAMRAVSVLFDEQVGGMTVCSVLSGAFIDAYRARVGTEAAISTAQVGEDFSYRKRVWVLDKTLRQIRRVTTTALRRCLDELVAVQSRLVTESVDERLEVERLICRLILLAEDRTDE